MVNKRGYSFAMWAVVFAIVVAATVMFLVPVKRAITGKTLLTTDHLMWGMWGNDVDEYGGRNYNQIGAMVTNTDHNLTNKTLENKGKVRTILDATATTTSSYSSY
jgi:hypothetical protein